MRGARFVALAVALVPSVAVADTPALSRTMEVRFTPVERAQIAVWVEKADGTFLATVKLTQAVSLHGMGNRPGASEMNSGFHWPYGRREGVLPVWAHHRAMMPGAMQFKRVIFQHRDSEGFASRTSEDSSPESYFCLSFDATKSARDQLDAVTCASAFNSDKGRFITAADIGKGYAEPTTDPTQDYLRPLDLVSLYPPRRDVTSCQPTGCLDHTDVAMFQQHARTVMPDIDAITMATLPADKGEQSVLFSIPADWAPGDYVAWIEVNVEGDYNDTYNDQTYPTPKTPSVPTPEQAKWDSWAEGYGYPYRGQPSVVYTVPFTLGDPGTYSAAVPTYYGDLSGWTVTGDAVNVMDSTITNDSARSPGSGADRLRLIGTNDYRVQVNMKGCAPHDAPMTPGSFDAKVVSDPKHSHQWGTLHFVVPASVAAVNHFEVRYSTQPIVAGDDASFNGALPALAAKLDSEALMVPTNLSAGSAVDVDFGGMNPSTDYWVAIRAVDVCNVPGPFAVAKLTTTKINFTKLAGCFIATAAYGSALEPQVDALRKVRDTLRPKSTVFATATDLYYRSGPAAAAIVARSDVARAVVRSLLAPVVDVARAWPGTR